VDTQKVKLLKVSKILGIILAIGGILLIAAIVLLLVLTVIAPSLDLGPGGVVIYVWGASMTLDGSVDSFRALTMVTILSSVFMAAILLVASLVCKDISREETPFTKRISNKIKVISLLLFAQCIVVPLLQIVAATLFSQTTDTLASFDLGSIVIAAVFFCLALVFEYGAELQRQADETL